MKDFQNKIVVITGGATGIGFSFAKQFGSRGAKLVIAGRRKNRLSEAVEKLKRPLAKIFLVIMKNLVKNSSIVY